MNKTIERLITAGLVAILIGAMAWQWVYGTNESAYKFGYNTVIEKSNCMITQIITNNGDDCGRAILATTWICGDPNNPGDDKAFDPHNAMTNQTACDDGAINGFTHWCANDVKTCQLLMKEEGVQLAVDHKTAIVTAQAPNGTAYTVTRNRQ